MHHNDDYAKYENVACLDDRVILTITSLQMLAEKQDGWFSDDDILDAADRFTIENRDEEGILINTADRDFLIECVYGWLEQTEEAC